MEHVLIQAGILLALGRPVKSDSIRNQKQLHYNCPYCMRKFRAQLVRYQPLRTHNQLQYDFMLGFIFEGGNNSNIW